MDESTVRAAAALGEEIARFNRVMTSWKQRLHQEHNGAERFLLARLVHDGERRATDLAADTLLDLSTVSRQVRSLVDNGLVERRPDPDDRRGALLAATEAGRAAVAEARRRRDEQLADLLEGWPADERDDFVRLFARFNTEFAERHARVCAGRPPVNARHAAPHSPGGEPSVPRKRPSLVEPSDRMAAAESGAQRA
jgi:DNA-binding MarR family transcriptional regulator